jgi:hypothetical protein
LQAAAAVNPDPFPAEIFGPGDRGQVELLPSAACIIGGFVVFYECELSIFHGLYFRAGFLPAFFFLSFVSWDAHSWARRFWKVPTVGPASIFF